MSKTAARKESEAIGAALAALRAKHKPSPYADTENPNGEYERAVDYGPPALGGWSADAWRFPDGTCIAHLCSPSDTYYRYIDDERFEQLDTAIRQAIKRGNLTMTDVKLTRIALEMVCPWFGFRANV